MAELKAVRDSGPDPKIGKQRPQSKTRFPYRNLREASKLATTIHKAGGVCARDQLAALLNHSSTKSGAFVTRLGAAKMFGLVEKTADHKFRNTQRGKDIVAPVSPERAAKAKVDAFLEVELFRKVYEQHEGSALPGEVGLRNLFESDYGIIKSRIRPTVRIMLDSAEYAGFFDTAGDRSRMVVPVTSSGDNSQGLPGPSKQPKKGSGSGGDGNGGEIEMALRGLLRGLPRAGTPMSKKRRTDLVSAFTGVIAYLYPDPEDQE
ncbi:MAG: hypothetical protein OXE73_03700 [Gammaproteobacteria bacterium]|nr:hypothetical protein [Gammaproteobacteria bacterium]